MTPNTSVPTATAQTTEAPEATPVICPMAVALKSLFGSMELQDIITSLVAVHNLALYHLQPDIDLSYTDRQHFWRVHHTVEALKQHC